VSASDGMFYGAAHAFVVVFRVGYVSATVHVVHNFNFNMLVPCQVCGALLPLDEKTTSSG
jgi:hypothetical protein